MFANMRARQILVTKDRFPDGTLAETVIWEVPQAVPGSRHLYKYSLFFGRPGERLIGYDNERGKGDHRHRGEVEDPYTFVDIDKLLEDFWSDVLA